MSDIIEPDICIIGGGSGGLSLAAGMSQLGLKTILVEGGAMGGDCLNTGCVPSKALLAAAHMAEALRKGGPFGIKAVEPDVDFSAVMDHVQSVIDGIAPHDSVERFEGLGVKVIQSYGSFKSPEILRAGDSLIRARRFVIATGSSPSVPPIPGLDEVNYLTNETIFNNKERPEHLLIIGGGPIGLEMAQAHRRLGAKVTVLALDFMENDDPELVHVLLDGLRKEAISLISGINIKQVQSDRIIYEEDGVRKEVHGSHILVATGRKANLEKLDLEAANVAHTRGGITVGANLRTSNRRIYAIGDVTGGLQFTHKAGYDAGVLIRRLAFGMFWAKADYSALPRVTYCSPELAQVGLKETEARGKITILRASYAENDRARAEHATDGLIKVIVGKGGRILGAGIAGKNAGEIIQVWTLAISKGLKISAIASFISPYPTLGEISKRAAGSYYTPGLFSDKTRTLVKFLSKLG